MAFLALLHVANEISMRSHDVPDPNAYENTTRTVRTRLGDLEYVGGFPTEATVDLVYDNLDFLRGVEAVRHTSSSCP